MKRIPLGIALSLMCSSAFAQTQIEKGQTARVGEPLLAQTRNEEGVRSKNTVLPYDSECALNYGGIMTVVGTLVDRVLIRYEPTPDPEERKREEVVVPPCPSGTLAFIARENFEEATKSYLEIKRYEEIIKKLAEEDRHIVRRLLEEEKQ
ncbi:MAG TPA: hypothetical protein VD928_04015 [Candidatus Paceibacterota bacterium]|nr:hypothetical protein [Candidatus Paceibacterota bacterium]